MKQRCRNKNLSNYNDYGGRGIKVCKRWEKFENFRDDMLATHEEHLSLDRIDNNGNYEPNNCRWATIKQQANNTRRSNRIKTNVKQKVNVKKKVAQISSDGKVVKVWESQLHAAKTLGLVQGLISYRCRNKKHKDYAGFRWEFA